MRRLATTTAVAAALFAAAAAPASAQVPGIELKLNPRIGLYTPLSNLGDVDGTVTSLENSLAIGLGAELQLVALPFGIRANLDYATGSKVTTESFGGGGTLGGEETTVLAVVGDLVFRPLPDIILLQPYLFVGGGIRQYDFDTEDPTAPDGTDPTIHLGFGLDFGLGPLALNAELSDYISWFKLNETDDESNMQHDLFVSVGFSIGLL